MIAAARKVIDGIVHRPARNSFEASVLHPFLDVAHVLIRERPGFNGFAADRYADLVHQYRRAQHFIVGKRIADVGVVL